MEMGRAGNGGGKVVTFDDAVAWRRRNGPLSSYFDIGKDGEAGHAARPLPAPGMGSRRRTYADGELDVFTAERYFKGAMDGDGDRKEAVAASAAAAARPVEAVVIAKPSSTRASTVSLTASSASSANSQTMLFRGGHRGRGSRDRKCCVQVGVLMRTCSGKRSVRVDGCAATKEVHDTGEPAVSRIDWYRELRMHKAALGLPGDGTSHGVVAAGLPPSLNLGTAKVAAIGREVTRDEKAAELTCSSSMRRSFTLVAPVRANVLVRGKGGDDEKHEDDDDDDDVGSESSSDLFEIKSLMIEECPYEPSEASIQWSVVTASAAGASERGDRASARWATSGGGGRGPAVAGRQYRDHRPVGLLAGCASHRAVDVSAATKAVPNVAAMHQRGDGFQKARNGA
ncbi:hypothetical protein BAE44_0010004 [Dichanthelium oligosanthes]|uniref:Uncharacterized protein n=1 Tax=Dichanthelium oligosanthes TaxID=888268 RepID=A0A1E5VV54_9POAL|nr:hypothetical protein BAE44_0010004 [Dichanthelium oligosanthes]